jgi:hypothetical protein
MINRYPDTLIYVLCPAHIVTGGIEAVHQLVDKLRKFGHKAMIVTMPFVNNPTLIQYRNYEVEFASTIIDSAANLLITTEVNPQALEPYTAIQKAIWWLSVDNHENLSAPFDFHSQANQTISHFVQSYYAYSYLSNKGIRTVQYLSDFLHDTYLKTPLQDKPRQKKDLVLYTPIKGADVFVSRLIQADSSITWQPLKGMIRKKHAQTLRTAKVYVDFGSHPGKDRQPREAAVNGCCVIVGRRGSARFTEDISIPEGYRFELEPMDAEAILSCIKSCLRDYETRISDFQSYANTIREEEKRFENEVVTNFGIIKKRNRNKTWIILGNIILYLKQNNLLTGLRGLANELVPIALVNLARRIYPKFRSDR